ncbi:MAG: hypothetical protein GC159_03750 [Phycisphaera sp.]|nr:hypothetical protein [Phycisphaera sp.]
MGLMSSTVEWAIFDPPPMFRRVGAVEQCELQKLNLKSACEMWPILKAMMRDLGTKEESLQFFEPMILNDIDLKPLDAIKTLGELARLVCGGKPMTRVETRITEARNRDPIPKVVQREVWRRDQGRCVECGSKEKLEFDHIIPHSKGGADSARNLQLLCESCNRRKGNLDPGQF